MIKYILLLIVLCSLFSCRQQSFREKICAKYINKELKKLPDEYWVNKEAFLSRKKENQYELIHILDITCHSCLVEISDNSKFINKLNECGVSFAIIGYSSYNDTLFDPQLTCYPFYFDFHKKFSLDNHLLYEDITKTFLIKENKIIMVGNLNDESFKRKVLKYL